MKKFAKSFVAAVLGWQVRRLHARYGFKIIGVAGSMGKTSTKLAIAAVLGQKFKVRYQEGNYNDLVSVPLVFFGEEMPALFNPFAWLKVFIKNELKIRQNYPYDFVIVELGTDGPGQIIKFGKYLSLNSAVVTAITPEHMQFFADMDEVANEELSVNLFASKLFINSDLVDRKYLSEISDKYFSYGTSGDFKLSEPRPAQNGFDLRIIFNGRTLADAHIAALSRLQLFSIVAAVAVGHDNGLSAKQLESGIESIQSASGRMQKLKGIKNSTIIDDTYNASPEAVKEALNSLYDLDAPYKVAILGSMNELGGFSAEAHEEVGKYCNPEKINLVLTIGKEANEFLAPAAAQAGCKIKSFTSPYDAGNYLKRIIKPHSLVLAKGSQNGVFAEEAIKQILANPDDSSKLVRQSPGWLKIKQRQFKEAK